MPDVCEIKVELKRLGIKGITGKRKAELLAMLPDEHEFRQRPARASRAAKPAPAPAPRPRTPSPEPIKAPAPRRVVARAVAAPEREPMKTIEMPAAEAEIKEPKKKNYFEGKFEPYKPMSISAEGGYIYRLTDEEKANNKAKHATMMNQDKIAAIIGDEKAKQLFKYASKVAKKRNTKYQIHIVPNTSKTYLPGSIVIRL